MKITHWKTSFKVLVKYKSVVGNLMVIYYMLGVRKVYARRGGGEHERTVWVAQGDAEQFSSFSSDFSCIFPMYP